MSQFTRPLFRFGGWCNLVIGVEMLIGHSWWYAALAFCLGAFLLTIGYRVATVLGFRLPWVRDDPEP